MTRLVWDQAEQNRYEAGVDRGVFYPRSGPGVVWNGLTSVQESPSDADERTRYIDGLRTRTRRKPGEFSGTIEAFTYPEGLEDYEGIFPGGFSAKRVRPFGMTYRVKTKESYKIHLVYNILLGPTGHLYEQEDVVPFSWDFTTLPIPIDGAKPTAHLVIEASTAYSWTVSALEDVIYGSDSKSPSLPSPSDVLNLFEENSILRIIDNGDGSFTAIGPDDVISMIDETTYQIDYETVVYISADTATIHSL